MTTRLSEVAGCLYNNAMQLVRMGNVVFLPLINILSLNIMLASFVPDSRVHGPCGPVLEIDSVKRDGPKKSTGRDTFRVQNFQF